MSNLRDAKNFKETVAVVTVAANDILLAEQLFDKNYRRMAFEVDNSGGNALDQFVLQGKMHADGDWHSLIAAWGTVNDSLLHTVGALESLASTVKGAAVVDVEGLYSVRIIGSANTGTSATTIVGSFS